MSARELLRSGGVVRVHFEARDAGWDADEVMRLLHACAGPLCFVRGIDAPSSEPAPAGFKQLFRRVRELRSTGGAADNVSVLVTSQPNKRNWFSAVDHEDPSSMFVHADDYGWLTAAPSAAVVAHQIVENVAECFLIAHGVSLEDYAHEDPRGCLHDFCGDRADLALKLRTADLCADCTWTLRELNASPPAIAQLVSLLEVIRRSCLVVPREGGGATGLYLELPYPAAVLRHRLDLARPGSVERVRRMIDFIDTVCRLSVFEELAVGASIREPLESITIGKLVSTLQHLDTHTETETRGGSSARSRASGTMRRTALAKTSPLVMTSSSDRRWTSWANAFAPALSAPAMSSSEVKSISLRSTCQTAARRWTSSWAATCSSTARNADSGHRSSAISASSAPARSISRTRPAVGFAHCIRSSG